MSKIHRVLGAMCRIRAALPQFMLAVVFIAGVITVVWSWSQSFGSCAVHPITEGVKTALSQYSETVKQILTLSTALAGVGAAVLLGLKEAHPLTRAGRIIVLASIVCFVFSSYFALLWQSWLAQLQLLECPSLITASVMQLPFVAETYFFVFGLCFMGVVVALTVFQEE